MNLVKSAKESKFQLPIYLLPFVAFGLNIIGDMIGGSIALTICNQFGLSDIVTNQILLLSVGINALIIFFWIKVVECRSISSIGLNPKTIKKESVYGIVIGLMTFTIILMIGWFLNVVSFQSADYSIKNLLIVLSMLPFWIVQAGAEEVLTRGWVLPFICAKSNRYVGIIISSLLFVCLHLNNAGLNTMAIVNIFLIGILLSVYTLRSNSLWKAIFFHACWNFAQGSIFGLSVSGALASKPNLMNFVSQGNEWLSGGTFGIEASIITTIVLLVVIVGTLLLKKKK